MILHRFMSNDEYRRLMAGEKLKNTTHHAAKGKKTTSVGFCFFPEDPEKAIHWLSGNVYPEQCVTMDIPDDMLTESKGFYRDAERDLSVTEFKHIERTEYCLTHYSLADGVRVISTTDSYKMYAEIYSQFVKLGIIMP